MRDTNSSARPGQPTGPGTISRRNFFAGAGGLAAMAALTAACGSSSGGGSSSGPSLEQWYHEYGEKGTEQAAQQFAASYKEAKVTVQWTPGDYATKLSAGLLSNSGPDVYESQFNVQVAQSKQAVPLDDIIAPFKHDFNSYDIEANTYDGHIYGVRIIDDPQFFYYRKSLFENKGLKPPETVDDLISIAKELTTSSMKGIFLGNDAGAGAMAGPALWSTGQRYLTADQKVGFDSPETGQVFQKLRQLQTDNSILLGAPTDWTDEGSFTNQLCAIQWCGLWGMPTIKAAVGDDFDVFPFPKFDSNGQDVVYSGGWTEFVSGKSHNIEAAKEFVKYLWLTSTKIQEQWALDYGYHIPPRISVAAAATPLQSGPALHAVELAKAYGVGDEPYWTPNVSVGYGDMVTNILRKGQSPGPQIAQAASIATSALQQLGV